MKTSKSSSLWEFKKYWFIPLCELNYSNCLFPLLFAFHSPSNFTLFHGDILYGNPKILVQLQPIVKLISDASISGHDFIFFYFSRWLFFPVCVGRDLIFNVFLIKCFSFFCFRTEKYILSLRIFSLHIFFFLFLLFCAPFPYCSECFDE